MLRQEEVEDTAQLLIKSSQPASQSQVHYDTHSVRNENEKQTNLHNSTMLFSFEQKYSLQLSDMSTYSLNSSHISVSIHSLYKSVENEW